MVHLYQKKHGNNVCDGMSNIMAVMPLDLFFISSSRITSIGTLNVHTLVPPINYSY